MMPAKAGETGAEREHDGEELRHADADDPRHVGIVDAGADHGAEPRAVEQKPKREREHHGDADDGEPIKRKDGGTGAHEAGETVRRGDVDRIAAPDEQAKIGGHEGDAECHQHLRQRLPGNWRSSRRSTTAPNAATSSAANSAAVQKSKCRER